MRRMLSVPVLLVCACDEEQLEETDSVPVFEATGDFACHEPGTAFLTQDVDEALQVTHQVELTVVDFESEVPVADVSVSFWYGDNVDATSDVGGTSGEDGTLTIEVPTCTPVSYKTGTDPALEETKDTYEAHQMYAPPAEGQGVTGELNSVSDETYSIIPALLGVTVETGTGVIAGTAYDCSEAAIEGATVSVHDAEGTTPDGVVVKYFVGGFPDRTQPYTSPDGLWVAMNVPPGDWVVEMTTVSSGETVVRGATQVQVKADSINISNIYTGYGDGVKYPAECLASQ